MLSQSVAMKKKEMEFTFVKTCGTPPTRGTAFTGANSALAIRVRGDFGKLKVDTSEPFFQGTSYKDAFDAMREVSRRTASYWAPTYKTFPEIDAVARCTLSTEENTRSQSQQAICMLQYTVGSEKTIDVTKLKLLKKQLEDARSVDDKGTMPVVLLFVTPPDVELAVKCVPYDTQVFHVSYNGPSEDRSLAIPVQEKLDHMLGKRRRLN